ncbi:hypothetical protein Nmel_013755 [Mimus melanotis]
MSRDLPMSPPRTRLRAGTAGSQQGHAPTWAWLPVSPHWSSLTPPLAAIGRLPAPPHAEVPRPAGRWRSSAMALVLALLSQALARVWRSPGSSARHAPPSRAMEHDRAIEVYDIIRTIRDPEKPNTLEELEVVTENCVEVQEIGEDEYLVIIRFTPTVPHCSLATLIGEIPFIPSQTKSTRLIWACLDAIGPSSDSVLPGCVGLTRNCILRTQPPMQANQKPNQNEQKETQIQ